ncbi:hypothetical protein [Alkalimarinus alittae]|uniref:Uncharacterized protein n=1 Tax=Alkalimarinus alittae TaxID=2961619 RepID=A0ABY6N037_9ALTE|nr:hypothetical protein [Alkalimarinus alittae]UZE95377.1 hypothetical protein NKI27_15080 [Alkalimarinus alittae]
MNLDVVDSTIDEDIDEVDDTQRDASKADEQQLSILFGTYADIMFILLPFLVVAIFKLWQSDVKSILTSYDLSMAAAILGGLAVVKFVVGLLIDPKMLQYKERLVFLISGTVFLVVVPGLLFAVLVMLADPVPQFAMFVQPLLLILGVVAYSGSVVSTNALLNKKED